jgi:hypothetical protein
MSRVDEPERKARRPWWWWYGSRERSPKIEYTLLALVLVTILPQVFIDQPAYLRISAGVLAILTAAVLLYRVVKDRRSAGEASE